MFLHSLAATTQDISLVRVDPDPLQQEFPCPHRSIEFRCQISVTALAIQWNIPNNDMPLEFGQADDIGAILVSSDNVYSANLTEKTRDPNNNNRFYFISTLLAMEPVNGSSLTCVRVTGADPSTESTSIILSGITDCSKVHL